jgi:transcription initiation factor TFIIB
MTGRSLFRFSGVKWGLAATETFKYLSVLRDVRNRGVRDFSAYSRPVAASHRPALQAGEIPMSGTRIHTEEEQPRVADPESETETDQCPECSGTLVSDEARGETVCEQCGLVVDEDEIDPGPEWRAFDSNEKDEKSRVGAPTTKLMHDKGLSTNIGWQDKDAYGNTLSSRQREKMQRLRTWDERFRTRDHSERNLKQALGEIERMGSALGLGESVRETASVVYRRALEEGLLPGRSIEGVASSAVYVAARKAGTPRTIDEVVRVSRIDAEEFKRTYRYVVRELDLAVEPADPEKYIARFASDLEVRDETERRARELLRDGKEAEVHVGKSPVGLAAAAIYAAAQLTNDPVTQSEVSEVSDMSEVTIRTRYQELLEVTSAV